MSEKTKTIINKETLLPFSVVLAMMSTFFGGIVWITNVYNLSKNNAEKITIIQSQVKETQSDIRDYNERVVRIEEKIDLLLQNQGINNALK